MFVIEDENGEVVKEYDLPSPPSISKSKDIKEGLSFFLGYSKHLMKDEFMKGIQTLDPGARAVETHERRLRR
jgi:hypothetical protein